MTNQNKKISQANTKREILDAYEELAARLDTQQLESAKPEQKAKERQKRIAIETADEISAETVLSSIDSLKTELNRTLSEIGEHLENEVKKYQTVKEAVANQEAALEDIYEIQKHASSLTALVELQRQQRSDFESEMEEQRSQLEAEIDGARTAWKREREAYEQEQKERIALDKKHRDREKAEFEYSFQREHEIAQEQFEHEKQRLERDIKARREELEGDLLRREAEIGARERELTELREKVEAFPKELQEKVGEAVAQAQASFAKELENRELLLTKEFEGERRVFQAKIEALEASLKEHVSRSASLANQVEKAYTQVQDVAVRAIGAPSRLLHDLPQASMVPIEGSATSIREKVE